MNGTCDVCGRNKPQIFTKSMTRGDFFIRKGKNKINH